MKEYVDGLFGSGDIEILMSDLGEQRRYGLILRGVLVGLKEVGIKGVWITTPTVENGRFKFEVLRGSVRPALPVVDEESAE